MKLQGRKGKEDSNCLGNQEKITGLGIFIHSHTVIITFAGA